MSPDPLRVVIAGGGVAGIEAALALRSLAPAASVELVTPDAGFACRQLSVVEPFSGTETRTVPYSALEDRGVTVTRAVLARVDAERHLAVLADRDARRYDALLVAVGAAPRAAFQRAITFTGPALTGLLRDLVHGIERGAVRRVAFVVPAGVSWPLPLYELVLQLAAHTRAELRVVTAEQRPLDVFGPTVATHVERLLERAGVAVDAGVDAHVPGPGVVIAGAAGERPADRVIALPVLAGRRVPGLPSTGDGFLPVDDAGRVLGVPGVYAAGDGTDNLVKQGGMARQQADRAVAALLADTGLDVPAPAEPPTLNAALITGAETWYLRRSGASGGQVSPRPLWWPPSKVVGHHLSPFLDGLTADEPAVSLERTLAAAQFEGDA